MGIHGSRLILRKDKNETMARRYFGTDGIRGKVGEAPITPDFVLRLGYAAGKVLAGADRWAQRGSRPTAEATPWP